MNHILRLEIKTFKGQGHSEKVYFLVDEYRRSLSTPIGLLYCTRARCQVETNTLHFLADSSSKSTTASTVAIF